jgi:hypothetical protein
MDAPQGRELESRRVLWISHRSGERCTGCDAELFKGTFIQINRETGIRCAECAGLSDLVYLPSGDPALTRRATALSARAATVVQFSKTRKRNERQGVLIEAAALEAAKKQCQEDAARRQRVAARRRIRDEAADRAYVAQFADKILELFPACPRGDAQVIALHACEKYSGRVGRSSAAKQYDARAITLAVQAHIRHQHTNYEELLAEGLEPAEARPLVADRIKDMLYRWREIPGDAARGTRSHAGPAEEPRSGRSRKEGSS